MERTYWDGVNQERARWKRALASVGIKIGSRHAEDVAQLVRWRLEVAEEMAIDVARKTMEACAEEGILNKQTVFEHLNDAWKVYREKFDEEMGSE